ncbi:hypothetical protein PLESTB_000662700 [Pleodorina starrii]|uniref:Uncharacterized protein n=1 Tax=Pleodorina starrii TaxID=330485 RepID=A0A9W6F1F8_9CHLO|nr:hypothetical protein PLESTB_000662700 [Pleodorina starrii]
MQAAPGGADGTTGQAPAPSGGLGQGASMMEADGANDTAGVEPALSVRERQANDEVNASGADDTVGNSPAPSSRRRQGIDEVEADGADDTAGVEPALSVRERQANDEVNASGADDTVGNSPAPSSRRRQGTDEAAAEPPRQGGGGPQRVGEPGDVPGATATNGTQGTGAPEMEDDCTDAEGQSPAREETERRLQVGHESVPAAMFKCEDIKQARSYLEMAGVVTLELPELKELLERIPDAAEVATQLCRLKGEPIFQELRCNGDGSYCHDETDEGRLLMDYGTGGQRWMVNLQRPSMPAARHAAGGSTGRGKSGSEMGEEGGGEEKEDGGEEEEDGGEEDAGEGAEGSEGEREASLKKAIMLYERLLPIRSFGYHYLRKVARSGESVQKAVVLANHPGKPGDPPVGVQATHVDLAPGVGGFVGFMPLAPVSVLVSPGSHVAVQLYHKLREAQPQVPEKGIMLSVSAPKMVRMHMKPGQIVLLHVNTVHAGDAGVLNTWSPRIHFYVYRGSVDNETHPVEAMGPLFAALF